jgi:hypothetical protein
MNSNQKGAWIGLLYIVLGAFLLFLAAGLIFKIAVLLLGLWLLNYGFFLRGINTRYMAQRYFIRFF